MIRQVFRVEISSDNEEITNCDELLNCLTDWYTKSMVIVEKHLPDEVIDY